MAGDDRGPKRPRTNRGRIRGGRQGGAPPRGGGPEGRPLRPTRAPAPRKPRLPEERPRLRRDLYADLRSAARPDDLDDLTKAFGAAGEAVAAGDTARAIELLAWAKHVAGRSAAVREAFGLALYHHGDYAGAHTELQTYRRLSGRADHNHVLADCARALGKGERVAEYIAEMEEADVDAERLAEGWIVLAGSRADRGDPEGALGVLERADLNPERVEDWHPRVWYFAATLAEQAGEADRAREYLEAVVAVDSDYLDAAERLEALDS